MFISFLICTKTVEVGICDNSKFLVARAYTKEDPPNRFEQDIVTECNEEPKQIWQRRRCVGMTLRNNANLKDDPKPLLEWITESPVNYATLKHPLPESKTDRIYVCDMDYRCDSWDEPEIYETNSISVKVYVQNPRNQKTKQKSDTRHHRQT